MRRFDDRPPSRIVAIGGGVFAVAGLAFALTQYARFFDGTLWLLTAAASLALALTAMNALPVKGLRLKRTAFAPEAAFLDACVAAPLFAYGGPAGAAAAALALAVGFGAAAIARGKKAHTDLERHGVVRVLVVLALVKFAPDHAPLATFAGALAIGVVFYPLLSAPLAAMTHHLNVGKILARVVGDPRTWIVAFGNVMWGTAVYFAMLQGEPYVAICMWAPVVLVAFLLCTIDDQRAELHRLRLVRDAVQAMLGDGDPIPQIDGILTSLRVPASNETVTVLAATTSRTETWRTVTQLGAELSPAGDDLRRRALARMKFSGGEPATLQDQYYIAYAFAVRGNEDFHGAIVVHRRTDRPLSIDETARFVKAASEFAPLLRDMRSIVARQNAATIDALTGLFNRATCVERLQQMLDNLSVTGRGAILLLDIDHFKSINDALGHAAGDDCLRTIGGIIRGATRSGDIAGRIGGEEFLVVMPGATRDVMLTVGDRLRLAVALGNMRYADGSAVTASIGVAAANAGDTVEALLARADRALYEAKRQGRNRVIEDTEASA